MNNEKRASIQWGGLLFALAGVVYCLTALTERGSQALCLTSGCALFKQLTIFGFSPWWFGAGAFLLIALLCLQSKRLLPFIFAVFFLALDCAFLLVMLFSAPCVSCLGAALLFLCTCFALKPRPDFRRKNEGPSKPLMLLLFVWGVLFTANLVNAVNELLPLRTLEKAGQGNFVVYISPSCPHCADAVQALGGRADFYAVSKEEGDLLKIARLEDLLASGKPLKEAMPQMLAEAAKPEWQSYTISPQRRLLLQWQLLRAKSRLAANGFTALPVVQSNGFSRSLFAPASQPAPAFAPGTLSGGQSRPGDASGFGLPGDDLGQCTGNTEQPCD